MKRIPLSRLTAFVFVLATLSVGVSRYGHMCAEDRAIATIVRSGGQVYYGFQEPKLSVRNKLNATTSSVAMIQSYDEPVAKQELPAKKQLASSFTINGVGSVDQTSHDIGADSYLQPSAFDKPSDTYFEVPAFKGSTVHLAERIMTDILRRIECATISGLRLNEDVVTALSNLRRLRQLIVYDSNARQRQQLAGELPDVEIIWR